ncbi:hypothetical protein [Robertmurraya sp.]|uniref:hypothetical protein n=1 Tax=Robertmurraya sp. TaxID=2837525 RepID=UPI0037049EE9
MNDLDRKNHKSFEETKIEILDIKKCIKIDLDHHSRKLGNLEMRINRLEKLSEEERQQDRSR